MDTSQPRSAADLVARFIETVGAKDETGLVPLFSSWRDVVGQDLAAHASPVDLRHGALIVQVDHPGWAQRLHLRRNEIIGRIRRTFPDTGVTAIHTYVGEMGDLDDTDAPGATSEARRKGRASDRGGLRSPKDTHEPGSPDKRLPQHNGDEKEEPGTATPPDPPAVTADPELQASLEGLARALRETEERQQRD